ncbi:uncharacterized protein LOC118739542 isoform X2 [Rhagoletis pomonella]|uniref:uncharacterized protein LOC118739542 isoform X2 n=1 Tax=Rhagoletis pomonella TaxID=28610 RepID=UPI00177D6E30|nr:uncharacterized protein LOC118739542 isoform X2 [Rhagoletis pomonella]
MNWSVADCKEKWKNMRNGFVRSLKPSPSGSSSKAKKPYYLHDIMSFVLPYVKPVQHLETTCNFILPDSDVHHYDDVECTENDEFHCDEMPQTSKHSQNTPSSVEKKKRKKVEEKDEVDVAMLNYLQEKNLRKTADNSRKMFLLSLLPEVTSLSDKRLRQFKIRTLLLLEELMSAQEQEAANQQFVPRGTIQVNTPAPSPIDPFSSTTF